MGLSCSQTEPCTWEAYSGNLLSLSSYRAKSRNRKYGSEQPDAWTLGLQELYVHIYHIKEKLQSLIWPFDGQLSHEVFHLQNKLCKILYFHPFKAYLKSIPGSTSEPKAAAVLLILHKRQWPQSNKVRQMAEASSRQRFSWMELNECTSFYGK